MKDNRKQLIVRYKGEDVGTLAITKNGKVGFQYKDRWIEKGFSISPFSLPLSKEVFVPSGYNLDGLFGVFYDSLPDSWGRLLVDRTLQSKGINPMELNALDRLAIVGSDGAGALEYYPEYKLVSNKCKLDIDELADECNNIIKGLSYDNLDELFDAAGSSGGARPKAFIIADGVEWLVKFQYSFDRPNSGETEFEYSKLAKKCGITMPETRLFPSKKTRGYFGAKRFDRPKIHMVSAAGLLETDYSTGVCDYKDLLKLTNIITNGNKAEIQEMYTRMCFNVEFNNQDDHLKNFAYIYDDNSETWHISPAYDVTNTTTAFNEHTTTVNGKGKEISDNDMIVTGVECGLNKGLCIKALNKVKDVKTGFWGVMANSQENTDS